MKGRTGMNSIHDDSSTDAVHPWFKERTVDIIQFRVNRRRKTQSTLFGLASMDDFDDHLVQVLLFGETVNVGKSGNRRWRLGNRRIDKDGRFVAGVIGWEADEVREEDHFDLESAEWISSVGHRNRVVIAPFSIVTATRNLFVLKHQSYGESTIATVFRSLLNKGEEQSQPYSNTSWDVEPILDERHFEDWVRSMSVLEKLTFVAKLPNPDGEEAFIDLDQHLKNMNAIEMHHTLKARDPNSGLTTDFTKDHLTFALFAMAKRGFARISAIAYDSASKLRKFTQNNRTKRDPYELSSSSYNDARDELANYSLDVTEKDTGEEPDG